MLTLSPPLLALTLGHPGLPSLPSPQFPTEQQLPCVVTCQGVHKAQVGEARVLGTQSKPHGI